MKKLIYFKNNDLVKGFCFPDSRFIFKEYFAAHPEEFLDCIPVCYGVVNYEMIDVCQKNNLDFIYIDNCYFGTLSSYYTNLKCKKNFYRVVFNQTSLGQIIERKDDRLRAQLKYLRNQFGVRKFIQKYKYQGKNILIIPPSGRVRGICQINDDVWINEVVKKIQETSEYNPVVRKRSRSRADRFINEPIQKSFLDAYATVSFNSCAAVESLIFGVPSFIYRDNVNVREIRSPAEPVSRIGLDNLNDRLYPEDRYEWLSHLAYGQFSREEMNNGFARDFILAENGI